MAPTLLVVILSYLQRLKGIKEVGKGPSSIHSHLTLFAMTLNVDFTGFGAICHYGTGKLMLQSQSPSWFPLMVQARCPEERGTLFLVCT